jgi:hypothetical protein
MNDDNRITISSVVSMTEALRRIAETHAGNMNEYESIARATYALWFILLEGRLEEFARFLQRQAEPMESSGDETETGDPLFPAFRTHARDSLGAKPSLGASE